MAHRCNKPNKKTSRNKRRFSNLFALFDRQQIVEFREFFNMIDRNRTGSIQKQDLGEMFKVCGQDASNEVLDNMLADARGPITFTVFLAMLAERMKSTIDSAEVLQNALSCLDSEGFGSIDANVISELLTIGDGALTEEDANKVMQDMPIEGGRIHFANFIKVLKCHPDVEERSETNQKK